jgi:hypothetical protein
MRARVGGAERAQENHAQSRPFRSQNEDHVRSLILSRLNWMTITFPYRLVGHSILHPFRVRMEEGLFPGLKPGFNPGLSHLAPSGQTAISVDLTLLERVPIGGIAVRPRGV